MPIIACSEWGPALRWHFSCNGNEASTGFPHFNTKERRTRSSDALFTCGSQWYPNSTSRWLTAATLWVHLGFRPEGEHLPLIACFVVVFAPLLQVNEVFADHGSSQAPIQVRAYAAFLDTVCLLLHWRRVPSRLQGYLSRQSCTLSQLTPASPSVLPSDAVASLRA